MPEDLQARSWKTHCEKYLWGDPFAQKDKENEEATPATHVLHTRPTAFLHLSFSHDGLDIGYRLMDLKEHMTQKLTTVNTLCPYDPGWSKLHALRDCNPILTCKGVGSS